MNDDQPTPKCQPPAHYTPEQKGTYADSWFPDMSKEPRHKHLCDGCPLINACLENALNNRDAHTGHWPTGIFGGTTTRERAHLRNKNHGTRGGYIRHQKLGEIACDPCKAANAEASRLQRAREKANRENGGRPSCGTVAGYRAHIRNREETCDPCRDAEAARGVTRRAKKKEAA